MELVNGCEKMEMCADIEESVIDKVIELENLGFKNLANELMNKAKSD